MRFAALSPLCIHAANTASSSCCLCAARPTGSRFAPGAPLSAAAAAPPSRGGVPSAPLSSLSSPIAAASAALAASHAFHTCTIAPVTPTASRSSAVSAFAFASDPTVPAARSASGQRPATSDSAMARSASESFTRASNIAAFATSSGRPASSERVSAPRTAAANGANGPPSRAGGDVDERRVPGGGGVPAGEPFPEPEPGPPPASHRDVAASGVRSLGARCSFAAPPARPSSSRPSLGGEARGGVAVRFASVVVAASRSSPRTLGSGLVGAVIIGVSIWSG